MESSVDYGLLETIMGELRESGLQGARISVVPVRHKKTDQTPSIIACDPHEDEPNHAPAYLPNERPLHVESIPYSYRCPISGDIMIDPMVAADGHTYEREMISEWFRRGKNTSPMTGAKIQSTILTPNQCLRSLISDFKEQLVHSTSPPSYNNDNHNTNTNNSNINNSNHNTNISTTVINTIDDANHAIAHPDMIDQVEARLNALGGERVYVALRSEVESLRSCNDFLLSKLTSLEMQVASLSNHHSVETEYYDDDDDEELYGFGFPDDGF
eukprot:m.31651 g.31651  ORF g.31651 m.31651 type:complete len:271 (+) comp16497_c0_seq1:299-1111(+)